jgi:hypothetical protein
VYKRQDDSFLSFTNTAGNTVSFITPNTISDSSYYVPESSATIHQVLGAIDNGSPQTLGWKTVPVQYVTVSLRAGGTYQAPFRPVLRAFPLSTRAGIIDITLS